MRNQFRGGGLVSVGLVVVLSLATAGCTGGSQDDEDSSPLGTPAPAEMTGRLEELALDLGQGSPAEVDLPSDGVGDDVTAFLRGEGKSLVDLLLVAGRLGDPAVSADCDVVQADLESLGTPTDLLGLASDIEDPTTREIASNLVSATSLRLRRCGEDGVEEETAEFAYQWRLWQLWLEQIA